MAELVYWLKYEEVTVAEMAYLTPRFEVDCSGDKLAVRISKVL